MAIFFAPLAWRPRWPIGPPPSRLVLWLLRWLFFRLMFQSGCVKLLSGDPSWHNLTAFEVHYATQPLPTSIGRYAHQLPAAVQEVSTVIMFVIELGVPFLIFAPRRLRLNDGQRWVAYPFRYKPGDPKRRPGFVAPHQPRLDWQMWFAALGTFRENPWFINFCFRLLEGSPEVLALLERNPFPTRPPRFIRTQVYDYHFTDWASPKAQGTWWRRTYKGQYCPVLSLDSLTEAPK